MPEWWLDRFDPSCKFIEKNERFPSYCIWNTNSIFEIAYAYFRLSYKWGLEITFLWSNCREEKKTIKTSYIARMSTSCQGGVISNTCLAELPKWYLMLVFEPCYENCGHYKQIKHIIAHNRTLAMQSKGWLSVGHYSFEIFMPCCVLLLECQSMELEELLQLLYHFSPAI